MTNLTDQEWQNRMDQALKSSSYELSSGFSDRVIRKLESGASLSKDYFWFGIGIAAILIGGVVVLTKVDFKPDFGVLKFLNGYPGFILFGMAFVLLLHTADRFLLNNGSRKVV